MKYTSNLDQIGREMGKLLPWAYMEPLPPLPRKGLASVTKWRRSHNEKGKKEKKKKKKEKKERKKMKK